MAKQKTSRPTTKKAPAPPPKLTCGLVMPISGIDGCTAEHWEDVRTVVTDAIESITQHAFSVRLVSDADDVGVIQKRIVHALYSADIVICDVSGKNPNVMFELGMRLAFDKPTVIVKDDKTDYSFDTGVIEHISYPRDLRFQKIVEFKALLGSKVSSTYEVAKSTPGHSTFLKNFGTFQAVTLGKGAASPEEALLAAVSDLQTEIALLRRRVDDRPLREGSRLDTDEVYPRMVRLVLEYAGKKRANSRRLIEDEGLYDFVEKALPGPEFFRSPVEFREKLKRIVKAIDAPGHRRGSGPTRR